MKTVTTVVFAVVASMAVGPALADRDDSYAGKLQRAKNVPTVAKERPAERPGLAGSIGPKGVVGPTSERSDSYATKLQRAKNMPVARD